MVEKEKAELLAEPPKTPRTELKDKENQEVAEVISQHVDIFTRPRKVSN